ISEEYIEAENLLKKTELEVTRAQITGLPSELKEQIFLNAYKYYKENSLLYNSAQACYYLADFYFKNGNQGKAKTLLNECLEICEYNGYDSFLIREYRYDKTLIESNIKESKQLYVQ